MAMRGPPSNAPGGPHVVAFQKGRALSGSTSGARAKNRERRGEERPGEDGLLVKDEVLPMLQVAEIELHQPLSDLELSRKNPGEHLSSIP